MNRINALYLVVALIVGAQLRFTELGRAPLWTDEALLVMYSKQDVPTQEWPGVLLARAFGTSDVALRLPYAIAGFLTIPAMFWVLKKSPLAGPMSLFVAVFPLFVFWSRMARPYALAGLFVVLSWRYYWLMVPALLATPAALLGADWVGMNWPKRIGLAVAALGLYLLRADTSKTGDFLSIDFLINARRIYVVPVLALCLHLSVYLVPFLQRRYSRLLSTEGE